MISINTQQGAKLAISPFSSRGIKSCDMSPYEDSELNHRCAGPMTLAMSKSGDGGAGEDKD